MNKIKKVADLEKILTELGAVKSSIEEINSFEKYSLKGDEEHDYNLLKCVYKFYYSESKINPYETIFYLIFSKNGGIYDVMGLGEEPKKLEKVWQNVEWEQD